MNLGRAILTGRPFRRKGEKIWYMVYRGKIVYQSNATYHRSRFKLKSDLKATDFEIKQPELPDFMRK